MRDKREGETDRSRVLFKDEAFGETPRELD